MLQGLCRDCTQSQLGWSLHEYHCAIIQWLICVHLQNPQISDQEILYFADVCAAPGGFAEYAIWRRKKDSGGFPDVHGFGFTLRSNDFKLQDFYAAPREFFEPHYGEMQAVINPFTAAGILRTTFNAAAIWDNQYISYKILFELVDDWLYFVTEISS